MQEKKTYYESYTLILKVDMKHDENKMNKLNQPVSERKMGSCYASEYSHDKDQMKMILH